jgi:hypothetical protein
MAVSAKAQPEAFLRLISLVTDSPQFGSLKPPFLGHEEQMGAITGGRTGQAVQNAMRRQKISKAA